jgi:hypothetical protein
MARLKTNLALSKKRKETMNTILHLAGEQPIPVYMGVMQFDCPNHVLAVTERTRPIGALVKQVCEDAERKVDLLDLDAYDMNSNLQIIAKVMDNQPGKAWGFNLTGGTKPMFAAAYQVAQQKQAAAFYIETTSRSVDWLNQGKRQEPLRPMMDSVALFVRLAGYEVMPEKTKPSPLDSAEGRALLHEMWQQKDKLQGWYGPIRRRTGNPKPGVRFRDQSVLQGLKVSAELKMPDCNYEGYIKIGKAELTLAPWHDLFGFICGGWLEEYLFSAIQPLLRDECISDLGKNIFVTPSDTNSDRTSQEFDLVFADGYGFTIGEIKAGDIQQEHIQKLENIARRFGGHFGKGIMIAGRADRLEGMVRERIEHSNTVAAVSADRVVRDPACLLTCKPGTITK